MTGFGVLADGGLAWSEGGEAVALAPLGDVFAASSLNPLVAQGPDAWSEAIDAARRHDGPRMPVRDARMRLPFEVADYVDFYSSREHVENMRRILRPDAADPLPPSWLHLPIGYHGRAGTVVVSGTDVVRPTGILGSGDIGPTRKLDLELELGFVAGVPSDEPVAPDRFAAHVFGVVLVNDWSARDIQAFEYVPLGPFLGKSFLTSISAWVTPLTLLADARCAPPPQDPAAPAHLAATGDTALDVELEIEVGGEVVSRVNARALYWTMPQQLAHATSNGATLRTGDLMATGTISGASEGSEGSLIERWKNTRFLADGDEVVLRGRTASLELGEVRGRVVPAR